jgi:hypothetical protein
MHSTSQQAEAAFAAFAVAVVVWVCSKVLCRDQMRSSGGSSSSYRQEKDARRKWLQEKNLC